MLMLLLLLDALVLLPCDCNAPALLSSDVVIVVAVVVGGSDDVGVLVVVALTPSVLSDE